MKLLGVPRQEDVLRLLFAGTPEPAAVSLRAVLDAGRHDVLGVLTRPEARAGRGRRVRPSPVAALAAERGIAIHTPARPGDPAFLDALAALAPDCVPVVAYGALVPPAALGVPRHGWVNLHFSLLPAWRGAAPVQHALIAGDEVTGASTFRLEQGLDTGPVYGVVTEPVMPRDTAGALLARLAGAGAALLLATLDGIEHGSLDPRPQPTDGVSLAPKLGVADAAVDWALPALAVDRRIRGCTPAPGAWTTVGGERLKLGPVQPESEPGSGSTVEHLAPGRVRVGRGVVHVGTGTQPVRLGEVQPAGRRAMPADAWARGLHTPPERLG